MLVDEMHQDAQALPQIMVHVPMDQTGLDHDFFIYKYEGVTVAPVTGTSASINPGGFSQYPLQADAAGNWLGKAAACHDKFLRTGALDLTSCGNGTAINSTNYTFQSKRNVTLALTADQGSSWKACRNTGVFDDVGNAYYMSLPSDTEWLKAADWGDLDQDGRIDQSVYTTNLLVLTSTLEAGTNTYCNTDNRNMPSTNNAGTIHCRSRFGAENMVGNRYEWTIGQQNVGVGYDNGVDGLWLGQAIPSAVSVASGVTPTSIYYDLLRALPKPLNFGSAVVRNSDGIWSNTTTVNGSIRGGHAAGFMDATNAGRWTMHINRGTTDTGPGSRCSR